MNLEEFETKYRQDENGNFLNQHARIDIQCDICDDARQLTRWRAEDNIKRNSQFVCASCAMKKHHASSEYTEDRKDKISKALTGITRSEETKKKMSEAKIAFFKTPKGEALKRKLSFLAAKGHAENKYENAKRTGWHLSGKTGDLVFYGSSYELRLCWELDQDPAVKAYETQISYEINERSRCLDCLITYKNGNKKAVEVKPESRLNEQANIDQINDSKAYAESQGWGFEVYTETNFGMTFKELRDWADVTRSQMEYFDWVEFRKEQDRKKANKHYREKISKKKVKFFCEYCKVDHEVLEVTHQRNVKKNGRFICHSENAHKPKPRKKKVNPHAAEGKKKCNRCEDVKLFEEFGDDKTRSDGFATRCKKCRREVANERYQTRRSM